MLPSVQITAASAVICDSACQPPADRQRKYVKV